jgi:hypothetical protein
VRSITAKKKFCSDLHRVYWNREKAYEKQIDEVLAKPEFKKLQTETLKNLILTGQAELPKSTKHPLWKENDPKEGSGAFYLKYDCGSYSELENKVK